MRFLRCVASLLLAIAPFACAAEQPEAENGGGCETGDRCADDTDCGSGTRCNGSVCTRLFCLPDGSACDTNDICESGECGFGPPGSVCASGPRPLGWVCVTEDACQAGLVCVDAVCRGASIPEGELCDAEGQCAPGLFCGVPTCLSGGTGLCSRPGGPDDSCCDATQCAAPYACRNVSCSGNVRRRCGSLSGVDQTCCDASDCQSGLGCEPSGFSSTCQAPVAPILRAMPESLELSMVQGGLPPMPASIFVSNAGTGDFDFSANPSPDTSWLMIDPYVGTVIGQGSVTITVSVIDAIFEPGTFTGSILVFATGATNSPLEIPVTFTISAP